MFNLKYTRVDRAHSKSKLPLLKALNPFILFAGNHEDGWYGDANWNPERKTNLGTALRWFQRNPIHNLCFHGIGFSDSHVEAWHTDVFDFKNSTGEGWLFHAIRPLFWRPTRLVLAAVYLALAYFASSITLLVLGLLMLNAAGPLLPVPFVSYVSAKTLVRSAYIGWRPTGAFGLKLQFNRAVSKDKLGVG